MTYSQTLAYIHSFQKFSGQPGLERMRRLMELLGNPQKQLNCVHVAGTNGKGSTCNMLARIAMAAGKKHVGLYTSPFVLDFRERIQLDRQMISKDELVQLVQHVRPFAEQVEDLTEFELITAMAFYWFAAQNCELVVLETGLGGRFDATNVIEKPLLSVITAIGLDHTAILGDTIQQIAFEKCGIIKSGVPVLTCPGQDTDAVAVILEQAAYKGSKVVQPTGNVEILQMGLSGTFIQYEGRELHIGLLGRHQVDNALTALTAARLIGIEDQNAWAEGVRIRFPARMELISQTPLTILDGAHNPQGAQVLAQALELLEGRPVTGVMGILADKDSEGVLEALAPKLTRLICVTPSNRRALRAHKLAQRADALGLSASAAHGLAEALELAQAVAASEGGAVVICGSLYLAAEARELLV